MNLMLRPFARYADFNGRARRAEFWLFGITQMLVYLLFGLILFMSVTSGKPATVVLGSLIAFGGMVLFMVGCIIPNYAVTVRRLHDTGRSGWWILLYLPGILGSFSTWAAAIAYMQSSRTGAPDPTVFAHALQGSILTMVGWVGQLVMLVFMLWPGTRGANRFGSDPKNSGPDISVFNDERNAANTARIDDAIAKAKAEADAARPPHKPIFDFGPGSSGPMINTYGRDPAPEPAKPAPAPWQTPAYDPGVRPSKPFGKR
ncbi:DUF805 domain-containing protein [Asticcacaulis sp. BYS171W]|uniref:DUF805 domain-containing protein n=1 Tax=Asticcacaulis aquaticus TaxID=2984212 RepID=A0ABT5HUR9_9CAUL|nr:DUF805 domain-containing protein [Asticcacaulis aquaticus]MDC7683808.1 DUF805 domain-containing protein [Asticcacaulis aquaticus]